MAGMIREGSNMTRRSASPLAISFFPTATRHAQVGESIVQANRSSLNRVSST
jgi:hypothetical protein